ncbi:phosphoenolpyruvate-utilizing protein [Actinomadura sp. LD22]|uniref:Phosphoenolpyruvate-utilizing protein n=1 Tax=Actinomadura physcomitrii TaxID=2650748 RepID=A0A6I4MGV7_9ACTN|nr:PEP-utilizing enzyme [Actinomadura physcomitrii]MWA03247.1 phosphoenolpyruvate-utilizing protein [Actinomadura physcomitrii]
MSRVDEPWICDRPASKRYPIYTRANIAEVFPGIVPPLSSTNDTWRSAEMGWREGLVRFGAFDREEFAADRDEMTAIFGGYGYLNVSVSRVMGVRMPGSNPDLVDYSYFGEQPGIPPYRPQPGDESPVHTRRMAETIAWVMSTDDVPDVDDYRATAARLRAERPNLSAMSNAELAEHAFGVHETYTVDWLGTHFFLIYCASVPLGALQQTVTGIGRPDLLTPLISGIGGIDSAAPSQAMWDLGRTVAASAELTRQFDQGVAGLDARLRASDHPDAKRFVADFDAFLYEYGSRAVNEWDLTTPTWETEPALALASIGGMRLRGDGDSPKLKSRRLIGERNDAVEAVRAALAGDQEALGGFEAALHAAHVFLPARERSKTAIVRMIGEPKVALHELASRFARDGHIDGTADLGMVTREEFPRFVADPAAFRDVIAERWKRVREFERLVPPFVLVGDPPPPSTWARRDDSAAEPAVAAPGETLSGASGCTGTAVGPARVILDPAEADELLPGEILVAPATDPSWTPLFVSAAAVVVDVGAPLSHSAIVSRELGIPCVVSCTGATDRIRTGTAIKVDGTAGTVTVM